MAWLTLLGAGLCEIGWALGIKYARGWTRLWPSMATVSIMVVSVWLLGKAIKTIPLGTAYAAWAGIGIAGTALVGIVFFQEPRDVARLCCIALIAAGVIGLKLFSAH